MLFPANPEECFTMARDAFDLAERRIKILRCGDAVAVADPLSGRTVNIVDEAEIGAIQQRKYAHMVLAHATEADHADADGRLRVRHFASPSARPCSSIRRTGRAGLPITSM